VIRKSSILALAICLLLTLLSPGLVQAQSSLAILDNSVAAEFPARLDFSLSTRSNVNITDIRLSYIIDRVSYTEVTSEVYVEFVPSPTIDVAWSLDMRRIGGLPPGSGVEYWWTVKDAQGDEVKTSPAQIQYDDLRHSWRSLDEGKITIYWYEGEESFARELMTAAQQALVRLADNTGAELEKPVKLYVYANSGDLQGAMVFPQEWTGGVAYTRYGVMAIGIAPTRLQWGKQAIIHELTHLVIDQITLNAYNDLPTWLDEGLAMYAEGMLGPEFTTPLNKAIAEDGLISVRSLSSPFSAYTEESVLSYAQSYSLVEFLISQYGQAKMLELLNTFKQGSSYDGALEKVYGFDTDGFNSLWQDYITRRFQPAEEKGMSTILIAILTILAVGLILALGFGALKWTRRQGR